MTTKNHSLQIHSSRKTVQNLIVKVTCSHHVTLFLFCSAFIKIEPRAWKTHRVCPTTRNLHQRLCRFALTRTQSKTQGTTGVYAIRIIYLAERFTQNLPHHFSFQGFCGFTQYVSLCVRSTSQQVNQSFIDAQKPLILTTDFPRRSTRIRQISVKFSKVDLFYFQSYVLR